MRDLLATDIVAKKVSNHNTFSPCPDEKERSSLFNEMKLHVL
jgi:hypothetical protein